jgi:hypothetical protein
VVYDDFTDGALNPDKWASNGSIRGVLEVERSIAPEGQLLQRLRVAGRTVDDGGVTFGEQGLSLTNGNFPLLQFDVTVASAALLGCTVAGAGPSVGYVYASMRVFNDGSSTGPQDVTGDVIAWIHIVRSTDFAADPVKADPAIFEAIAQVYRCTAPTCEREVLSVHSLGLVLIGQPNTFSIRWDAPNNLLLFQRNAEPPVVVPNVHPVAAPRTERLIGLVSGGANCTVPPRPVADMLALIDNVVVLLQ